MKHFYSHLIEIEIVEQELSTLNLSEEEKKDLLHHVHTTVHYKVLDIVLSELSEEDKKIFLQNLKDEKHENLWSHLKIASEAIEEKIKDASSNLLSEFIKDVNEIKEKHKSNK